MAQDISAASWRKLQKKALAAAKKAYAPYSGIQVGACLMTKKGRLFHGCNIENASYSLTICAERNALFSAISSLGVQGKDPIVAIAVARLDGLSAPPCGACRQVLYEFCADVWISFIVQEGKWEYYRLSELLPNAFRILPQPF
ncbi:MAG: cytidine deaminase [Leptospiraceae bacterium]|nr:cytidine deaminase [Leptospiraceae bacterium]